MVYPRSIAALARSLAISRSRFYYRPKRPEQDWTLKINIENVLHAHPAYGSRRIAWELKLNRKRIQRVMQLYGIHPYRRRAKRRKYRINPVIAPYENLLLNTSFPLSEHMVWVSDFTELRYREKKLFIATVMDLFTRKIIGWHALLSHTTDLVLRAFQDAMRTAGVAPAILHSDQGSEYASKRYTAIVEEYGIRISMSRKGSPWENGYQESFYSQFKLDLGHPERFNSLGELIAAIAETIYVYNFFRIHTKLKMPPALFAMRHQSKVETVAT